MLTPFSIKVDALEEFEDLPNMTVTEVSTVQYSTVPSTVQYSTTVQYMTVTQVYEDEEFGDVARVEIGQLTVTTVTPQVASEFEYQPGKP